MEFLPVDIRASESINAFKHKLVWHIKKGYVNIVNFQIS